MKKIIAIILGLSLIGGGAFYYQHYKKNKTDNVAKSGIFIIPKDTNLGQVLDSIRPYIKDMETFQEVAEANHLAKFIKRGKYQIKEGDTNIQIVNMIKNGLQKPDTFRIINFEDVYRMVGRVSRKTEADSLQFVEEFNKIAQEKGLNSAEDLKHYFFADTYEFYWTTSPREYFSKFEKDYNRFWNEERLAKEKNLGLSREQIYALASIVQKESGGKVDEQKTIAGLYLNRYKKGMKLQSDPTVIYAINKEHNFTKTIKRVYKRDLAHPSPYNTYANAGIPPGPICVVDKNSVDSVLDAEDNNYIYMCADPERIGYHKFTHSDAEHMKNARAYHEWLNKNKIK